jgi:hypothetical protein
MSLSSAGGNATTFRRFVVLTQHGCRFSFRLFGRAGSLRAKTDNPSRGLQVVDKGGRHSSASEPRDAIRSRWASRQQARPQPNLSSRTARGLSFRVKRGGLSLGRVRPSRHPVGRPRTPTAARTMEASRRTRAMFRRRSPTFRFPASRVTPRQPWCPPPPRRACCSGKVCPRARRWPRSWAASSPAASPWRTRTRTRGRTRSPPRTRPRPTPDGPADRRRGVESG